METVHRLCEDEFFDWEDFRSRSHFLAKVNTYWCYFNVARKNGYKGDRSPLELLRELAPKVDPRIALWQPVFLDTMQHTLLPEEIQRLRGKNQSAHPYCHCPYFSLFFPPYVCIPALGRIDLSCCPKSFEGCWWLAQILRCNYAGTVVLGGPDFGN